MVKNVKKDIKDEKMKANERGSHDLYDEPGVVGSLGGVAPYAEAQKNFYLWWCSTLINNG